MNRQKLVTLLFVGIVFVFGGILSMNLINQVTTNQSQQDDGKIDGQPIYAPQLSKTNGEWRNGAGIISDGKDTNSENRPTRKLTKTAKSLIIYFSRSGSTELLASKIEQKTHADILEIVVKNPYAGNYGKTLSRANSERDNQDYPELNMQVPDLKQYQTIYLGYPIWAMTVPHPMVSFLNTYGGRLINKRIAPFMTEGGYGQGDSVQRIQQIIRDQGGHGDTFTRVLVIDGNKVDRADQQTFNWVNQVNQND